MLSLRATAGTLLLLLAAGEAPGQSWTNLTPPSGPAPAARRNASAILDPVDRRMVVFGGFGATYLNDIWAFDLDTESWADLTPSTGPAPAPRLTPASIYDPDHHRMITWSGQGQGVFFNDVWAFDLTTNTWSPFMPAGGPPNIRYGVGFAFDPVADDLVTFAGFTNMGRFDDVWRFNGEGDTWTDVSPGSGPLERCLHAACYDAQGHRMIMYGGQNAGPLDDIWALDLDTHAWTDLTPATRPAGRYFTGLVYDAANHRVTVFGGQTASAPTNEVWVFDLRTNHWTQLTPSGTAPSARWGSPAVYDGAADRMVVFGGSNGSVLNNELWSIGDLSDTPTATRDERVPAIALHPNHPNPFNPATTIAYELPASGRAVLRVFDAGGRLVRTLVDAVQPAGLQSTRWDGLNDDGAAVGSGVYFCRLDAAGVSRSRKMVLLK
jgi:N-acetylneuraminic acid mutarotase